MPESAYRKIEDVHRPIKVGEVFNVPCLIKTEGAETFFAPVIGNAHNDKENGQPEVHYHVDYRFVETKRFAPMFDPYPYVQGNAYGFVVTDARFGYNWYNEGKGRLVEGVDGELKRFDLPVMHTEHLATTQQFFIRNTKLKHKCIHKGKCPHRGYDLSQEIPKHGKITCPMHGLEFNEQTGKILPWVLERLKKDNEYEKEFKKKLLRTNSILQAMNGRSYSKQQYLSIKEKMFNLCYSVMARPNEEGGMDIVFTKDKTDEIHSKQLPEIERKSFSFKITEPLTDI